MYICVVSFVLLAVQCFILAAILVCVCVAGGLGLKMIDEVIVAEELAYGCTGISTATGTNMLAVSQTHTTCHCIV